VTAVVELVATLQARGVMLRPDGDRLHVRPVEALTPEELAALREHKADVLALLAAPPSSPPRYFHPWPDSLPGLGRRTVAAFDVCADCGAGTWARYGDTALCLACARARERGVSA
jgi:hypothetical protein